MNNYNELLKLRAISLLASRLDYSLRQQFLLKFKNCIINLISNSFNNTLIDSATKEIEYWQNSSINCVSIYENTYPKELSLIPDPPLILFYKGKEIQELDLLNKIALVGSRNANIDYFDYTKKIASELSFYNLCTISGLATGIDSAAHLGALEATTNPLPTVAILGHGLDIIYPKNNMNLAAQILAQGGVLISQFEPGIKPLPYNFLNRNRIIAALSSVVFIAQAGLKSGALNTAKHALEFGKDLLALPGHCLNPNFAGNNYLIKQGAALVTELEDILEFFPDIQINQSKHQIPLSLSDSQIFLLKKLQQSDYLDRNSLKKLAYKSDTFHQDLLQLELEKLIISAGNNNFYITSKGREVVNT